MEMCLLPMTNYVLRSSCICIFPCLLFVSSQQKHTMDRSRVQFYRRETSFLRSKTETTTLAWACEVDWVQLGAIVETCGILAPVHNVVQRCHQEPSSYLKKLPTEVLNMVISELHNLEYDLKLQEWVQTLRCCQRECDIYYHYLGQELEEVQSIRDKWRKENVESGRNHVLLCGPEYETMHDDCCRAVQNLLRDKVLGRNPSFNADREVCAHLFYSGFAL